MRYQLRQVGNSTSLGAIDHLGEDYWLVCRRLVVVQKGNFRDNYYFNMTEELPPEGSIEDQLSWHFRSKLQSEVPSSMTVPCKLAILAAREGDWQRLIELPEGVSYRGQKLAPAKSIVQNYLLEAWVVPERL